VTRLAALGRWIIGFAVVGLMLALLWFRSAPPTDLAAVGASPTETPAATQTPTPSPSPTVEATPTPTATPTARPTPAPTPRPTPTDGGAGGPLTGPGTPPPGWTPPPYGPVDVIVTGPFGSSLTSGGMTVTASVLPDEHGGGGCPDSGQKPQPDFVAVGYAVNVRWSGFSLAWPTVARAAFGGSCFVSSRGSPISGETVKLLAWHAPGSSDLDLFFFPNGKGDPAYVFRFR